MADNLIRWEEEILHGKYAKKPKTYDLMTECIECIEYTKYIGYIGDITKIEIGEMTIITCNNHGLNKDEYVHIEDSDSKPTINHTYQISEIIDNNSAGQLYKVDNEQDFINKFNQII